MSGNVDTPYASATDFVAPGTISRGTVSWDGEVVLTTDDATFTRGHVGLLTKADSVTAYDDLEATTL